MYPFCPFCPFYESITCVFATPTRVRLPPPPPFHFSRSRLKRTVKKSRGQTLASTTQTGGPAFGLLDGAYETGAPFFAQFAKGGSRECRRKFVDLGCVVTNPVAHAASLPTLAKNARMGHPRLERRTRKIMRAGHPHTHRLLALSAFGGPPLAGTSGRSLSQRVLSK